MAKKGAAVQLQHDVQTDNEFEILINRPGLIVVDVYSEWCGPCLGMIGTLRKIKMEYGGDYLTFAIAKSDSIALLSRFVNKSRPTWMFIADQRMVRLVHGSNGPGLTKIIWEEIQKTTKAMGAQQPREGIDIDELTEAEQFIEDERIRIIAEREEFERNESIRIINERREEIANNLVEQTAEFNLILLWPHIAGDGLQQIFAIAKDMGLAPVGRPMKHLITDDDLYEMFYYSTWTLNELERQELQKDEAQAVLYQTSQSVDIIAMFQEKFYGAMKCPPGEEESIAMKFGRYIQVEKEIVVESNEEIIEPEIDIETQVRKSTILKNRSSMLGEDEDGLIEVEQSVESLHDYAYIPGLMVMENEMCKVLTMRIFFPHVTVKYDLPEIEPTPPQVIIAFEASKRAEIFTNSIDFPTGTMNYGFFTHFEPDKAKLICKGKEHFERLPIKPYNAKLIFQISKQKSEPLLSYALLAPVYVSPNCEVGLKECEVLFTGDFEIEEPELLPEPVPEPEDEGDDFSVPPPSDIGDEGEEEETIEEEYIEQDI